MNKMPVNPLVGEDFLETVSKTFALSLPAINKNKLDKAQARRLKMPKRNRSAYFLFSMDIRAKLKAEPNTQLTPLETQALVSKYWKDLAAEEKEKYEQRAKEEKVEYLAAMDKFYSSLTPETIEKSKTNKPKKPCSAYAHFVRDIKTELKRENPRLIMQEILHIVSEKWKNLPEEKRAVYEEMARKDKEQYMAITRNYNSNETQDSSPKRRKESQDSSVRLGKRLYKIEELDTEEKLNKQIKIEGFSVKSETQIELDGSNYTPVKFEEYKATSNISMSPIQTKIDSEYNQLQQAEKLRGGIMYMNEPTMVPMNINPWNDGQNVYEMPGYFVQGVPNNMNMGHYMYNNVQNNQQINQAIAAKMNLARMVQNHQNLEQSIMQKMMEIKTLQAQRLMVNREFFLATANAGGF